MDKRLDNLTYKDIEKNIGKRKGTGMLGFWPGGAAWCNFGTYEQSTGYMIRINDETKIEILSKLDELTNRQ